jgi:hypothetical protein
MIMCADCSHFDGMWCQAPSSWDGKRGQDANELHNRSTHCDERKKAESLRGDSVGDSSRILPQRTGFKPVSQEEVMGIYMKI